MIVIETRCRPDLPC